MRTDRFGPGEPLRDVHGCLEGDGHDGVLARNGHESAAHRVITDEIEQQAMQDRELRPQRGARPLGNEVGVTRHPHAVVTGGRSINLPFPPHPGLIILYSATGG